MSAENVGGLVALLACPCCSSAAQLSDEYEDCDGNPAVECSQCNLLSWGVSDWNTRVSAHGHPVVDAVPPEAVEVEGTALLAGAVKLGDWAIPTQCGARIVDARMAYGWNQCREAMLESDTHPQAAPAQGDWKIPISWADFWIDKGNWQRANDYEAFDAANQWLNANLAAAPSQEGES